MLLHAAVIWGAAAIIRLPSALWRTPRTPVWRAGAAGGWLAGAIVATLVARAAGPPIPIGPLWVALLFAGGAGDGAGARRPRTSAACRRARGSAVFFLALLAPAIAMYPSLLAHATEAKERLVADEFGPQAVSLREDLAAPAAAGGRADRRDPGAGGTVPARRHDAGDESRLRGLVAHRAGDAIA